MTLLQQEIGNKRNLLFEERFISDFEIENSLLVYFVTNSEVFYLIYDSKKKFPCALSIYKDLADNKWENLNFKKIVKLEELARLTESFFTKITNSSLDRNCSEMTIPELILMNNSSKTLFNLNVLKNKEKHCIILSSENKLILVNEFEIRNFDEMLFFILSIMGSEKIKNENLTINLFYNAWQDVDKLKDFLLDYFKNVEIPEANNVCLDKSFNHYKRQIFLMNQVADLCE